MLLGGRQAGRNAPPPSSGIPAREVTLPLRKTACPLSLDSPQAPPASTTHKEDAHARPSSCLHLKQPRVFDGTELQSKGPGVWAGGSGGVARPSGVAVSGPPLSPAVLSPVRGQINQGLTIVQPRPSAWLRMTADSAPLASSGAGPPLGVQCPASLYTHGFSPGAWGLSAAPAGPALLPTRVHVEPSPTSSKTQLTHLLLPEVPRLPHCLHVCMSWACGGTQPRTTHSCVTWGTDTISKAGPTPVKCGDAIPALRDDGANWTPGVWCTSPVHVTKASTGVCVRDLFSPGGGLTTVRMQAAAGTNHIACLLYTPPTVQGPWSQGASLPSSPATMPEVH